MPHLDIFLSSSLQLYIFHTFHSSFPFSIPSSSVNSGSSPLLILLCSVPFLPKKNHKVFFCNSSFHLSLQFLCLCDSFVCEKWYSCYFFLFSSGFLQQQQTLSYLMFCSLKGMLSYACIFFAIICLFVVFCPSIKLI